MILEKIMKEYIYNRVELNGWKKIKNIFNEEAFPGITPRLKHLIRRNRFIKQFYNKIYNCYQ